MIVYRETNSKHYQGDMKDYKHTPKSIHIHKIGGRFCSVSIIKKYINLIPAGSKYFCCRPNSNVNGKKRYQNSPVGKIYLDGKMKKITSEAGWDTTQLWTGHSLGATAASSLMEKQIPEFSVKNVTGHRSSSALQEDVRSDSVQKATSNTLASPLIHLNKK